MNTSKTNEQAFEALIEKALMGSMLRGSTKKCIFAKMNKKCKGRRQIA